MINPGGMTGRGQADAIGRLQGLSTRWGIGGIWAMPGPGQSYSSAPRLVGCRRASQRGFFSAKGQPLDVVISILMEAREENVQWHPHGSGNCRRSLLSLLGDTPVRVALVSLFSGCCHSGSCLCVSARISSIFQATRHLAKPPSPLAPNFSRLDELLWYESTRTRRSRRRAVQGLRRQATSRFPRRRLTHNGSSETETHVLLRWKRVPRSTTCFVEGN